MKVYHNKQDKQQKEKEKESDVVGSHNIPSLSTVGKRQSLSTRFSQSGFGSKSSVRSGLQRKLGTSARGAGNSSG